MAFHRRSRSTWANMNLKHLETFIRIVEKGSFAAAADTLHTTQSTVSARVKDLEHYFGVELFDRSAHRAQLTPKGRRLFDMSQQVIQSLEAMREQISDRQALTGTLRLGAVGVVAGTWLPQLARELRTRHPGLELQIEVVLTKTLLQKVRSGHLDAAMVVGRIEDDALHCEVVGEDRFAWMASPVLGVPRTEITPAMLAGFPILAFPPESHHHAAMKAWFRTGGIRFAPVVTCNNMDVIARMVAQGTGVGMLPAEFYGAELALGQMEVLRASPAIPDVEFMLVSFAGRETALVSALTDAVRAVRRRAAGR
jgi:DNA-binding transcriptional LysR family regulator